MSSAGRELGLDADVLMNLLATDQLEAILATAGLTGLIGPKTKAEAIYLNPRTAGDPREAIDLAPGVAAGSLLLVTLTHDEQRQFVSLARDVDDGEAQVLAICSARDLVIATDDRKARRLATGLSLTLMSTPELVIGWGATVDREAAAAAIRDVETRARFRPRPTDPLRPDWDRLRAG